MNLQTQNLERYSRHPDRGHKLTIPHQILLDEKAATQRGFPATGFRERYENMCRYTGSSDRNYKTVVDTIKGFIEFSSTRQLWNLIRKESSSITEEESRKRMKELLESPDLKADPNLWNYDEKSALHQAVKNHKVWAIPMLVSEGADVNKRDGDGRTAFQIAVDMRIRNESKSEEFEEICGILLQAGANERRQQGTSDQDGLHKLISDRLSKGYYVNSTGYGSNRVPVPRTAEQPLARLSPDREAVCRNFDLTITSFCPCEEDPKLRFIQVKTVFDALYTKTSVIPPKLPAIRLPGLGDKEERGINANFT